MTLQKRWLATLSSALMSLLCVVGGTQAAQAYDDRHLTVPVGNRVTDVTSDASSGEMAPAAWTPNVTPLYTEWEEAHRNLTTEARNYFLNNCPNENVCIAVGQGDGRHTVFKLWYCNERTLSNFINAGAVANHQLWPKVGTVRFTGPGVPALTFAPRLAPYSFDPLPYNRVEPC
ncbi:hypothetical protein ACO229_06750 [Promicromonospora sp. MS192]|uniref:hypothetical protein n=1 Tax=Promicromonospora sp. MS192 TaxID=3412684 RepID=UPI003C2AC53F